MPAPNPFNSALHQLQSLHDEEVVGLRYEIERLQQEIERLQSGGGAVASLAEPPRDAGEGEKEAAGPEAVAQQRSCRTTGDSAGAGPALVGLAKACVNSQRFDLFIGLVICANAATIGIETSFRVDKVAIPTPVVYLEYAFLVIYTAEIVLRFIATGPSKALKSNWVKLDLALVLCGYLDILAVLVGSAMGEALNKVLLIRILRLARLVRVMRMVVQFRNLYLLVSGLMNSILTLVWTGTVIFVLIYCFSILGLELIQPDDSAGEEYNKTVDYYFNGLFKTMLTLLQGVTLDSVGGVYRPLIVAKPHLFCYFIVFILLVSIALMNLVTAIMVEAALDQAGKDKESHAQYLAQKKREHVKQLHAVFHRVDVDGSGMVSLRELEEAGDEVKAKIIESGEGNSLKEVFQILDYDNSGEVGIDEFCEGMLKIESGTPMELFSIQKLCANIFQESRALRSILSAQSLREPRFASIEI